MNLKVTPRARREMLEAPSTDGALRARVTAPANDGKANAAVIALLAAAWDMPKSALTIASGHTSRRKRILVRGDSAVLIPRLSGYIAAL